MNRMRRENESLSRVGLVFADGGSAVPYHHCRLIATPIAADSRVRRSLQMNRDR